MQRAPAGLRAHILKVQACRIEHQIAHDAAKSGGKILSASESVFDVYPASDPWPVQRSFKGSINLCGTACVDNRHKTGEKSQVQSSVEAQTHRATPGKLN